MAPSKKEILIPLIHGTKLYPRDTHDDPWGGGGGGLPYEGGGIGSSSEILKIARFCFDLNCFLSYFVSTQCPKRYRESSHLLRLKSATTNAFLTPNNSEKLPRASPSLSYWSPQPHTPGQSEPSLVLISMANKLLRDIPNHGIHLLVNTTDLFVSF